MEPSITPEQRERAARQKELSLARRQQRLQNSSSACTRLDWNLADCTNVDKTGANPINIDCTINNDSPRQGSYNLNLLQAIQPESQTVESSETYKPQVCVPSPSKNFQSPCKSDLGKNPSESDMYNNIPLKSGICNSQSESGICKNLSEEGIYTPLNKTCLGREDEVVARNHALENDVAVDDDNNKEDGDGEHVSRRPSHGPVKFSKQQMQVLEAVARGKSVFMTGSAGTGKSFVLKYIIRILKNVYKEPQTVFVTASTGLAACALGGTTLHSFAGIGLGNESPDKLLGKVLGHKDSRKRWISAKVLIIDEISMIDGELFDKLDYVARKVKNNESCFGGIQLIVTGDFFQLPPVNPPNPSKYFAFQADCWNRCFDMQIELGYVFRQSDGQFVNMLNEIRKGLPGKDTLESLNMCIRPVSDDGTGIAPTRLYPLKRDVREENLQNLRALREDLTTYTAADLLHNPVYKRILDSMRSEKELQLCVGAQVMLIKNLDPVKGLVNGSKGVVVGFETVTDLRNESSEKEAWTYAHSVNPRGIWPVVRFESCIITIFPVKESAEDGGYEVVSRVQLPLILAWALSVHKCQGMTLNKVETDLSKAFEYGMVYVALSRVKGLDGLQLTGFDPKSIKAHPNVVHFSERLSKGKL